MVSVCIAIITSDVEHLFMFSFAAFSQLLFEKAIFHLHCRKMFLLDIEFYAEIFFFFRYQPFLETSALCSLYITFSLLPAFRISCSFLVFSI